jgi:large subunit ribosomal protein L6
MSRVGKQIITIPEGTTVTLEKGDLAVKGPKGELSRSFKNDVEISINGSEITLQPINDSNFAFALWGTYASHIKNMVDGVNTPYEKKLIVEGVGFRVALNGNTLTLNLGFSHEVNVVVPEDISVGVEKNTITISGINKESVGQFAAKIRALKKPEPYKGKGIRYDGEFIRRKQGKKS